MKGVAGTYLLVLRRFIGSRLNVGRLGAFWLPPGFYLYAGSARSGLGQRIRRHLRRHKPPRWHIDYLREESEIWQVWWTASLSVRECDWYREAMKMPGARAPVRGFGSSDCRCYSHLVYLPAVPDTERLRELFCGEAAAWTDGPDGKGPES